MLKSTISLIISLAVIYAAYQIYKVYDTRPAIEADLNKIIDEYRSRTIYTQEEVTSRISKVLVQHNTKFDPNSFILKMDENKPDLSFSADYKKAPDLPVVVIPISFHVEIPATDDGSGALGKFIKNARTKLRAADKVSTDKLDKVDSTTESK
jgi:hypothetical protein